MAPQHGLKPEPEAPVSRRQYPHLAHSVAIPPHIGSRGRAKLKSNTQARVGVIRPLVSYGLLTATNVAIMKIEKSMHIATTKAEIKALRYDALFPSLGASNR